MEKALQETAKKKKRNEKEKSSIELVRFLRAHIECYNNTLFRPVDFQKINLCDSAQWWKAEMFSLLQHEQSLRMHDVCFQIALTLDNCASAIVMIGGWDTEFRIGSWSRLNLINE